MKSIATIAIVAFATAFPSPTTDPAPPIPCANLRIRREWYVFPPEYRRLYIPILRGNCRRSLSVDDRKRYIKAVNCTYATPPKSKKFFPIVTSLYEDLVALHSNATGGGVKMDGKDNDPMSSFFSAFNPNGIHSNAVFMPWCVVENNLLYLNRAYFGQAPLFLGSLGANNVRMRLGPTATILVSFRVGFMNTASFFMHHNL
jgi:hypothetical protein